MNLETIKSVLEIMTLFITIFGAPIAVYLYFKERNKERKDREYGTYNALDDKYIDFLNLCLAHTDLDLYNLSNAKKELTQEQLQRRDLIFEILICLFERAFLMYQDQSAEIRKRQWDGWNAYMEDWMDNENFRKIWGTYLGTQYDQGFVNHMNVLYQQKAPKMPIDPDQ